ncbi:TonB-dependent siderophore receptor [Chitinophaga nivalis]|uniref:TonB-dependent receptor n=1 Tax=Chitinophaga nivalis TaxID=2991709 RepID=A0ABT3IGK6_9BACT|nr:TonB-dependent receptor [Chitinophaga nivalis]MCW3467226.1 TonB-dependent receptor [Chitinophaga nivalis]MCW3483082.1 TonB-dependent receptor [Chitinophaga nivalis]
MYCNKKLFLLWIGYLLPAVGLAQDKTSRDTVAHRRDLGEVVIAGQQDGYRTPVSSIATRTATSLLETPQSVQVVGQAVIKDRQAATLNELVPLMTGVKANNGMGGFSMRGFSGYNPAEGSFIMFNGVRGNLYLWNQPSLLYNIERVEVLRGPASVLFSEGMPGGLINFVTKKPQATTGLSVHASYGSWDFARFAADATGALSANKKWLYRAIAGYDRSNSFRDQQHTENIFLAPSFTWQPSVKTAVNLELNYARTNAVHSYDRGTFVKKLPDGSYDFNAYPKERTVQSPDDYGKNTNTSATLTLNHTFNDRLSLTVVQRYVRNQFNFADHFVAGAIVNDSINRTYSTWDNDQFNWQTTAYAGYRFHTGRLEHNILTGFDYNRFGWTKNLYRNYSSTRIGIWHPDYRNDVPPVDAPTSSYDDNKQVTNLIGGYVQDQIGLLHNLKVLLSLRYDHYKMVQTPLSDKDDVQGDHAETGAWVPRAGIVYLPLPNLSVYGSFTRSFNPHLSSATASGGPFPPKTATQFEAGAKGDFFRQRLSAMVAVYHIAYRNLLAPDPTTDNPRRQVTVPGTRSQGAEVTLQGNLKNVNIIAGYAYNDHQLTNKSTIGKKGDRYVNAPHHIANVWVKYNFTQKWLKGFGIGAGGRYVSDQVGNMATQDFVLPAYTVLDAALNYDIRRFSFQFNINNITNTRYFNGGISRNTVASLGNPLNARIGVNFLIL